MKAAQDFSSWYGESLEAAAVEMTMTCLISTYLYKKKEFELGMSVKSQNKESLFRV